VIVTIWTEKNLRRGRVVLDVPVVHARKVAIAMTVIATIAIATTVIAIVVAVDRQIEIPKKALGVPDVVKARETIAIEITAIETVVIGAILETAAIEITHATKNRHSTRKCRQGTRRSRA